MSGVLDLINPYAIAMRARRQAYHRGLLGSEHPGIPVISIGNLSMGGSGKTPITIAVAKHLIERGKRVAVVSRGYRRNSEGFVLVQEGTQVLAGVAKSGDEAQLLAMKLPAAIVIVDEDRLHGARQAKNLGADVVLLDDGYQHMRIRRDVNVLAVDSSRGLGSVIPFGRLREPVSAAADADAVVYTNADRSTGTAERTLSKHTKQRAIFAHVRTKPVSLLPLSGAGTHSLGELQGARVLAVSSIAAPQRFYQTLRTLGAEVVPHALRDHASYDRSVIERTRNHARTSKADLIVTTEKDGVKSASYFASHWDGPPAYLLPVEVEFMDGEDAFFRLIDSV